MISYLVDGFALAGLIILNLLCVVVIVSMIVAHINRPTDRKLKDARTKLESGKPTPEQIASLYENLSPYGKGLIRNDLRHLHRSQDKRGW